MKKLKHVISNFEEWNDKVLGFVYEFYGDKKPEFIDDTKTFYTQKQIYILFSKNYNELIVKFDTKEKFINALQLALIEYLPQLYISSLAFVNDEFQKLLDETNRGDIQKGTTFGTTKQKNKQGIPPSDLQVKDDLAELHIKNAEFMENFGKNETNAQVLNLLGNLKQIINSKITSKIFEWLNNFAKLFSPLICDEFDWKEPLTDILHELRDKVEILEAIIDADKLQDLYNEVQGQLQALKDELDAAIENAKNQNIETLQANIQALETKYNTEIKKIWDYMDDNEGLLKKFEELYNQLHSEITALDGKVEANKAMFANVAFINKKNRFNTDQAINGYIDSYKGFWWQGANLRLGTLKYQTTKQISFMFIQDKNVGYRNFSGFALQHKISTQADADAITFFKVELRNTITTMNCWGNYLEFEELTRIGKVDTPTSDNDVATKKYVDDMIASGGNAVDLSTVAKTDAENVFESNNTFRVIPQVKEEDGRVLLPQLGSDLTPKAYVDSKIYTNNFRGNDFFNWTKSDAAPKLYSYNLKQGQKLRVRAPQAFINENVAIYVFVNDISGETRNLQTGILVGVAYVTGIQEVYEVPLNSIYIVAPVDLKPGAVGDFNGLTSFNILMVRN